MNTTGGKPSGLCHLAMKSRNFYAMNSIILREQKQFQFCRLQLRNDVRLLCLVLYFHTSQINAGEPTNNFKMIFQHSQLRRRDSIVILNCV